MHFWEKKLAINTKYNPASIMEKGGEKNKKKLC